MNVWELAILRAVSELGDNVQLKHIYHRLEKSMSLDSDHLCPTAWSGRPAYQHQVRSHISNLCQARQFRRVARATYEVTAAGRARLRAERR